MKRSLAAIFLLSGCGENGQSRVVEMYRISPKAMALHIEGNEPGWYDALSLLEGGSH
jgi:hypothetical protein